ncbi:MAG: hypothetical protein AAF587_41370 [Bacteroidota bacterium]
MKNKDRNLVLMIDEIAVKHQIDVQKFSHDWIIRLQKGTQIRHIFGYNFPNNSSTAQMIANDKSATSELLQASGVPVVEHKLFLNPKLDKYVGQNGNWHSILEYFQQHHEKVVCKAVSGTGGNDVFLVRTQIELEQSIQFLFSKYRSISLSPFVNIRKEYRAISLNQQVELLYQKNIQTLLGNGSDSVLDLIRNNFAIEELSSLLDGFSDKCEKELGYIPEEGEEVSLNWKSNLGHGAKPIILSDTDPKSHLLTQLAEDCARVLNIQFASVDIVETSEGEFLILEVNSGVMVENFVRILPEKYSFIKGIYEKAILSLFADD